MQQPLYHRYSTAENEDEDEDEGAGSGSGGVEYKVSAYDYATDMLAEGISGLDVHGSYLTSYKDEDPYGAEDAGARCGVGPSVLIILSGASIGFAGLWNGICC